MREARKNLGLVVVNNRIYAVGGQGALGNNTITITHCSHTLTKKVHHLPLYNACLHLLAFKIVLHCISIYMHISKSIEGLLCS